MVLPDFHRAAFVLASISSGGVVVATIGVTDEHAALIVTIVGVVSIIAAGIAWLDRRMKGMIRDHEKAEFELKKAQHENLMAEIRHVRELIDIHGQLKKLADYIHPDEE